MKERIEIRVAEQRLKENEAANRRLAQTERFEPADRAPVLVDNSFWYQLAARRVPFGEFIENPRSHLRHHLLNLKWRLENILDDRPIETEKIIIEPNFGALRGAEFPIEIEWLYDSPPKSHHLITELEQIDRLALPDPVGGLNAKRIEFYREMKAIEDDFEVCINGQRIPVYVTLTHPGGSIPSAFALCGSNLFLWMRVDPDRVHRLLDLTTRSHIQCVEFFYDLVNDPDRGSPWIGCDTGEMVSAATFRTFVVPYYNRIWEHFGGRRIFHMCGKINHLLDILRDEMKIDRLEAFGFPVPREMLAEKMAGRVVLRGGLHPVLIHDGPPQAIFEESLAYLRTVGRQGGYILADGAGLMDGTPPEHINAMVKASQEAGSWSHN